MYGHSNTSLASIRRQASQILGHGRGPPRGAHPRGSLADPNLHGPVHGGRRDHRLPGGMHRHVRDEVVMAVGVLPLAPQRRDVPHPHRLRSAAGAGSGGTGCGTHAGQHNTGRGQANIRREEGGGGGVWDPKVWAPKNGPTRFSRL